MMKDTVASNWLQFHSSLGGMFTSCEDGGRVGMPSEENLINYVWSGRINHGFVALPQVSFLECWVGGRLVWWYLVGIFSDLVGSKTTPGTKKAQPQP